MTFASIYGKNAWLITMNKCTIKFSQQCILQSAILVVSLGYHNVTVRTLSDYVLTCILHVRCYMSPENMNLIILLPDLSYCMCVHLYMFLCL